MIRPIRFLNVLLLVLTAASAQQIDPSFYQSLQWRLIGPFRGGRALTVTGVSGNPDLFYFGSVGGGVWKSTDAGTSWQPIFDAQSIASIGALAVAPSDPNLIYVGSGEADMRSDISYGNGVYKSTDAGAHWQNIGLKDSRQIGKIIVDPKDPNRVFVAALGHAYGPNAERGVFRSTDGGATWQKVLFKDENTGAIDIAFSPSNPDVIYASMWQTRRPPWNVYPPANGAGSGFYKSTDGGGTWKQITAGVPSEGLGHIGIAVSASSPNRVYLAVDAKAGGVFRSDDAGESFQLADNDHRLWQRGWYFGGITADPKNADVVYIANTSTYRSTDGGKTFTAIKGAPGGDDYHSVWVSPDNSDHIAIACDQGTIISLNGGKTWSSWYNQPTGQFYHVSTDNRFPYWVYGPQQDSGAMALPSRSKFAHISEHDWRPLDAGGESGEIAADPLHPNILFGGTVTKYDLDTSHQQDVSPNLGLPGNFRRTWTLPLTFSAADPHKLYLGHQMIFETKDSGHSWQQISPDLTREVPGVPPNVDETTVKDVNGPSPRKGVVYAIAPSPRNANLVWAGTDDGLIHLTRDDGKTWQNVTPASLTPWSKVGIIDASHFDEATAYAAIDRHRLEDYKPHILRTHDAGKTWTDVSAGIPDGAFANVVREDPVRKGLLYAGTELGMYVSFDDGTNWQPLQMNLPVTSVRDIVVHGDDLVIATHGRAFWVLDDMASLREIDAQTVRESAYLFKPQVALRVRPGSDEGTPQPPEIAKGDNPPAGAIIDYYLHDATGPLALEIVDASNAVVRHWSSDEKAQTVDPKAVDIPMYWFKPVEPPSTRPGMHRWIWDLHYAAPAGMTGKGRRGADIGAWAPPGQYRVRLTVGGKTLERPLTLKPDPRIKLPQAVYDQQFSMVERALNGAAELAPAIKNAAELQKQIAEAKLHAPALASSLDRLSKQIDEVAGAPVEYGAERPDGVTLNSVSSDFLALAAAVDSADAVPTAEAVAGLASAEQSGKLVLQRWSEVMKQVKSVPQLNLTPPQGAAVLPVVH